MPEVNVDDLRKRIDTAKLYPIFDMKMRLLYANCHAKGMSYWALEGLRSYEEQAARYAIGRTVDKDKPIVTKARPGRSAHNYGIAEDAARDADVSKPGLQPAWAMADYKIWAEEGVKLGLDMAYYWKGFPEGPHAQLPLKDHLIIGPWDNLVTLYKVGGQTRVWAEFDKHTWSGEECRECKRIAAGGK